MHVLRRVKVTDMAKNTMKRDGFIYHETEALVFRALEHMNQDPEEKHLLQIFPESRKSPSPSGSVLWFSFFTCPMLFKGPRKQ